MKPVTQVFSVHLPLPHSQLKGASITALALHHVLQQAWVRGMTLTRLPGAVTSEGISALQFQAVQMACAKHETFLADGKTRAGFFLGDGALMIVSRGAVCLVCILWACHCPSATVRI